VICGILCNPISQSLSDAARRENNRYATTHLVKVQITVAVAIKITNSKFQHLVSLMA